MRKRAFWLSILGLYLCPVAIVLALDLARTAPVFGATGGFVGVDLIALAGVLGAPLLVPFLAGLLIGALLWCRRIYRRGLYAAGGPVITTAVVIDLVWLGLALIARDQGLV